MLLPILFSLIVLYFLVMSIASMRSFPRMVEAIRQGALARANVYLSQMAGLWLPALLVAFPIAFVFYGYEDLGLGWFRPGPGWLVIGAAVLAALYLGYLLITLFAMVSAFRQGKPSPQKVSERLAPLVPVTTRERKFWACTALTAGFTEELLFRGFVFYALGALFPALPAIGVLLISTVLFGLGHLYQGPKEALQPMALGLVFGALYLAFGTIWPCVVLHVLQDLVITWVGREEKPAHETAAG